MDVEDGRHTTAGVSRWQENPGVGPPAFMFEVHDADLPEGALPDPRIRIKEHTFVAAIPVGDPQRQRVVEGCAEQGQAATAKPKGRTNSIAAQHRLGGTAATRDTVDVDAAAISHGRV